MVVRRGVPALGQLLTFTVTYRSIHPGISQYTSLINIKAHEKTIFRNCTRLRSQAITQGSCFISLNTQIWYDISNKYIQLYMAGELKWVFLNSILFVRISFEKIHVYMMVKNTILDINNYNRILYYKKQHLRIIWSQSKSIECSITSWIQNY